MEKSFLLYAARCCPLLSPHNLECTDGSSLNTTPMSLLGPIACAAWRICDSVTFPYGTTRTAKSQASARIRVAGLDKIGGGTMKRLRYGEGSVISVRRPHIL